MEVPELHLAPSLNTRVSWVPPPRYYTDDRRTSSRMYTWRISSCMDQINVLDSRVFIGNRGLDTLMVPHLMAVGEVLDGAGMLLSRMYIWRISGTLWWFRHHWRTWRVRGRRIPVFSSASFSHYWDKADRQMVRYPLIQLHRYSCPKQDCLDGLFQEESMFQLVLRRYQYRSRKDGPPRDSLHMQQHGLRRWWWNEWMSP